MDFVSSDYKWDNDSTYIGTTKNNDFYFLSPFAELGDNEDDYNRHWVFMSDELKLKLQKYLKELNEKNNLSLPIDNELTSYDNPDYLWLSYVIEDLRRLYNNSMRDSYTGELINGCGQIPYIQLCLKSTACDINSLYPESTLNSYGIRDRKHYVINFQQPFLRAFINFIIRVFDDNPKINFTINKSRKEVYQFIAPIYRINPFNKYFKCRHDLPGIIIIKAVEMLIAHEIAHVGGGHLDLKSVDSDFGNNIDTIIAEENDADIQAMCWILGMRFLEIDGLELNISYSDFKGELALTVFSVYLLYTWAYSKDKRIWNENTIKNYGRKSHLPYQLRAYTIIQVSKARFEKLKEWCKIVGYITSDGNFLTDEFFDEVFYEALDMIDAFEISLHMFFARTEDVYESALNNNFEELQKMINFESEDKYQSINKENVPWLLGYEKQGQAELKRVNDLWKSVRERLSKNGTYCRLRDYEEWKPL